MKKKLLTGWGIGLLVFCVIAVQPVSASLISWADWIANTAGQVTGNIQYGSTIINVTYTGNYSFAQLGSGTNYWTEGNPQPYTGNSVVDNAPTPSELIALNSAAINTVIFSQPVVDPIMAIVSMGQGGLPVTYDFNNAPFTVLSEGRGYWGDGTYTLSAGDILTGRELHAAIQFTGTFSQISWSSTNEYWHGFTFGIAGDAQQVPEPATMLFLGFGLFGLAGISRKFKK